MLGDPDNHARAIRLRILASLLRRPRLRDPSIALLRFAALGGIEIDRGRRDSPRHGDFRFAAVGSKLVCQALFI